MGLAELKYFETEGSLTRVIIDSLYAASLNGLFQFCLLNIYSQNIRITNFTNLSSGMRQAAAE